jgi:hypothetical protein
MSKQNLFGGDVLDDEDFNTSDRGDDVPSLEDTLLESDNVDPPVPPAEEPAPEEPEGSTDPEGEAEKPEAEAQPDAANPPAEVDKQLIPRARFNEVNDRAKAAERRAQELEARLNATIPPTDYDFESKEREYMDAVLEGDHQKALGIRRDIRAAEMEMARSVAATQASQAKEATKAELEFEQAVASIEVDYPAFSQSSTDYNQELVDEALELHAGFVSRGYSPAAAMRKAVAYVANMNGLTAKSQAPAPAPAAPKRTTNTVKSKLDMAASQPPVQSGVSGGETEPDYRNLSDEEWDALPKATIARLRGDLA